MGFAGDFSLGVLRTARDFDREKLYGVCKQLTGQVDIAIANFESIVLPAGRTSTRRMSVPVEKCGAMEDTGFTIFSIANNHILDCGEEALLFTREFLKHSNILSVGAGKNIVEAEQTMIMECEGKRLAFFSATDATHYGATRTKAGICRLNQRKLIQRVSEERKKADLVVVSIHSDLEFTNKPAPWKMRLSRRLARAGANIIVHHHPHTLQGIEYFEGTLIAYSLGNFVFPVNGSEYMREREGHVEEGVFLIVEIEWCRNGKAKIGHRAIPTYIDAKNQTKLAQGIRAKTILQNLDSYAMYLQSPRVLTRSYFQRCKIEMKNLILGSFYAFKKEGIHSAWSHVILHLRTLMHRNWIRGFFTFGFR